MSNAYLIYDGHTVVAVFDSLDAAKNCVERTPGETINSIVERPMNGGPVLNVYTWNRENWRTWSAEDLKKD